MYIERTRTHLSRQYYPLTGKIGHIHHWRTTHPLTTPMNYPPHESPSHLHKPVGQHWKTHHILTNARLKNKPMSSKPCLRFPLWYILLVKCGKIMEKVEHQHRTTLPHRLTYARTWNSNHYMMKYALENNHAIWGAPNTQTIIVVR